MNPKLRQHYLYLWQLVSSLEEGWWEDAEKDTVKKLLKDAITLDPELNSLLGYPDPDLFQKFLPAKLQFLILENSFSTKGNLPPEDIRSAIVKRTEKLSQLREKPPVRFYSEYSTDIYLILKKYKLVDGKGTFNLSNLGNSTITNDAQAEIDIFITQKELQQKYQQGIIRNLEGNKAPVTLFSTAVFGDKDMASIVDIAAERMAKAASARLRAELLSYKSFKDALSEVNTAALLGEFLNPSEADEMVDILTHHPTFQKLTTANQDLLKSRLKDALIMTSKDRGLIPDHTYDILIRPEDSEAHNIRLEKTPVGTSGPDSERIQKIKSETKPKTIAEMSQQAFGLKPNVDSTENIQRFIEKFAKDPIGAILEHPYYSFINLLPGPIKRLYWNRKNMQKKWDLWYGITVNPDAQRDALQKLGLNAIKSLLKLSGLVNEKGQWAWMSTLGWLGDKAVTGIGEGLSKLVSRIPFLGKALGPIVSNRLGEKRNRQDSLLTGLVGIFTDTVILGIKYLPKIAAWGINKLFPEFSKSLTNFYFNLDKNIGFFGPIKMGIGLTTTFIKSIFSLNTLAGGGFGFALGGLIGNYPLGIILGGASGATYQFWYNLANNTSQLGSIIFAPFKIPNFLVRFLMPGVYMHQYPWLRFPLKGLFGSLILWQLGFPWYIVISPPILQWLWETKGWWGGKIATALASRFPIVGKALKVISDFLKSLGIIGEILGGGLPGLFFALQLGILLHLSLPQILLLGLGGWVGWGIAAHFFPTIFGLNLFSLAGGFFGQWLAAQLGLTGGVAFAMQLGSFFAFNYLGSLGLAAISSWLGYSITLGGLLFTVVESIFYYLIPIIVSALPLIMVLALLTVIVYTSLFLNPRTQEILAPATSECFAPTKNVEILDKNTRQVKQKAEAGDILRYTINFGVRKEEIKNVILKDEFREAEFYTSPIPGQSWAKSYLDSQSFTLKSTEPVPYQGPSSITDRGYGSGAGYQESWQRVVWSNFTVTSSTPGIIYEIKVSDGNNAYKGGTILNQILLDGSWTETVQETYTDPDTLEIKTRPVTRKANCKVALSGYVNSGTKEAADLAITIFQALNQCQKNPVTGDNLTEVKTCLTNANIPQAAIDEIAESVNKEWGNNRHLLQCVGFIKALEAATGGNLQNIDDLPNARSFWRDLPGYRRKYRTTENKNDLKPGDILIWTTPPEGHMAIVLQPIFDAEGQLAKIIIAEAIGGNGYVRIPDPIPYDSPGLAGWLRRN